MHAEIVHIGGVVATERIIRATNRLQDDSRYGLSSGIEHFQLGIEWRFVLCRLDFKNNLLTFADMDPIQISISLAIGLPCGDRAACCRIGSDRIRGGRSIVGFLL